MSHEVDPCASGVYRWWHVSKPPPELLSAEASGEWAAARVLRPGGRLLLRMCLNSAGVPNGLDEETIRATFRGWRLRSMERVDLVSDTRSMPAVMAILVPPAP